jgi:cytochrome c-type biogenesis protein CcmH/NrfF
MLTRVALILSAIAALYGLAFGFSFAAEALGDWTDAHPDRAVQAWSLWNLGLVALAAGAVVAWRRYRRGAQPRPRAET